ncbi:endonuclease III domain-containing protein [Oculatella sp. LEGE 06141]|uniref:endonuclease III domain-containing protein n=1 Tax=Oculatella sp. LEGE 06141 TaxID=1828648 RepID=UPI001D13D642|nr:endonuclease III [Oculatella sp. LEGE 06141]
MSVKQPFDINRVVDRIREAVRPFPKAAMFALAEEGYISPFEQLIACLLSIRTYDETSLVVARHLFTRARTPAEMVALTPSQIETLIRGSTYADQKAGQIWAIANRIMSDYNGVLPCDASVLLSFTGVGPKCTNLALGIACGQPCISVDIHVHRVTNRWGYVETRTPEKTLTALEKTLPRDYWIEINQLLVPFGKHICTGKSPHCSTCPVVDMCQQVGVSEHR